MFRRAFLKVGLMLVGVGRRARAQPAELRYARLSEPIRIPVDQVALPWRPVTFTAEAMAPIGHPVPGGGSPGSARRVLISGVVFRRASDAGPSALSALCLTCPHEQCRVDLVTDPAQLAAITGRAGHHPVFECGCHLSVFDAQADGSRIAGEAPRGLYRFRVGDVVQETIEIHEVEAEALTAV